MKKIVMVLLCMFPIIACSDPSNVLLLNVLNRIYGVNELQLRQLKLLYEASELQIKTAKKLVKDAEGHYGYGALYNSTQDLTNQEWSPDDWENALKGLSGSNKNRYQALIKLYQERNQFIPQSKFIKGSDQSLALLYKNQTAENQAASVNASYAFNTIKTSLEHVHQLSKNIEKAPNTKAAIDLNSRLLEELSLIQIQQLKMQSITNEQLARQNADRISAESASAEFEKTEKR